MPRNGSGTYVAPVNSWNPAQTGTVIEPTDWNAQLSDYSNALTQSISKDGQTTYTNNQPMGGNKLTGLGAGTVATDSARYDQTVTSVLTTRGDMVYRNATVPARLAIGTSGQILRSDGTDPVWTTVTGADIVYDGSNNFTSNLIVSQKTDNYSLLADDRNKAFNFFISSSIKTATLLAASTAGNGYSVIIENLFASTVNLTIAVASGSGFYSLFTTNASTITLRPGESATFTSDGTIWLVTGLTRGAASTTVLGLVEKATQAETNAGTADKYPDAAAIKATRFISTGTAISVTTALTFAHGFAVAPVEASYYVQCTSTDKGYAVGDRIHAAGLDNSGGGTVGTLYTDSTNVGFRLVSAFRAYGKGDTTLSALDTAKWDLYLWAKAN